MVRGKQTSADNLSIPSSSDDNASASDTLLEKLPSPYEKKQQPFWREHRGLCMATIATFIFLILLILVQLEYNRKLEGQIRKSLVHSPANEAVEWKVVEWAHEDGANGDYVGEPRPDLEKAWKDIFNIMNVQLSEEDIKAVGRLEGAVSLPDGSGYIGTLNVYHELHCVWFLYKYIHADHYFPGATPQERAIMKYHSHHCLNMLRKSAMCHGDVGLVTYSWDPTTLKPEATGTSHQCVVWDRITEWSRARAVNMTKPGYLVHPILGPMFREEDKEQLAVGAPPHFAAVDRRTSNRNLRPDYLITTPSQV